MKKITLLVTLLLLACSPVVRSAIATALPTTCKVYSTKSWIEEYGTNQYDSSFSQTTGSDSGTTVWERINGPLLAKILSVNGTGSGNIFTYQKMWEGKNGKDTGNYFRVDGLSDPNVSILWNWVGPPSPDQAYKPGERNYVCVSQIAGGYAYIVTAPRSANYDWVDGIDWLHWTVYGNWPGTPQLFTMIPADPASFDIAIGASNRYFIIPASWLLKYIRTDPIPWRQISTATPTPTPTSTAVTPPVITATRTPECHYFSNISNAVCVP